MPDFLADTLSSSQLLALLYLRERERRGDTDWREFLDTFATRLANLGETLRFEVLQAHLMSVEDLDIYDDSVLHEVLDAQAGELGRLTEELTRDPRFNAE